MNRSAYNANLIDAAVDQLERFGVPVTPENVLANVRADYAVTPADHEPLILGRIRLRLATTGRVIADEATRERRPFADCSPDEYEAQVRIEERNAKACADKADNDRRVVAFLRSKEQELGRPVTAGEFLEELAPLLAERADAAA